MARTLKSEAAPNVPDDTLAACLATVAEFEVEEMRLKARKAAMWRGFEAKGINKVAAIRMHKLAKLDDAEREMQLATERRYLAVTFGFDKDGQGTFVATLDDAPRAPTKAEGKLRVARAHADGYNTGKAGGDIGNNKFPTGSEEFVAWRDGWQDGASDRKLVGKEPKKAKEAAEEAPPPPARRGRKKQS